MWADDRRVMLRRAKLVGKSGFALPAADESEAQFAQRSKKSRANLSPMFFFCAARRPAGTTGRSSGQILTYAIKIGAETVRIQDYFFVPRSAKTPPDICPAVSTMGNEIREWRMIYLLRYLISMVASCALVLPVRGERLLSLTPVIRPSEQAHSMASCAHSAISPASVYAPRSASTALPA